MPAEIAGIGSTQQKLRVSPGFDPLKAAVGPEEYFVLSRIDGSQTLRDVLLATGLSVDRGIAIVQRLRSIGALLLPGETSAPAPTSMPRTVSSTSPPRTVTPMRPMATQGSAPIRTQPQPSTRQTNPQMRAVTPPTDNSPSSDPTHDLTLAPRATADEMAALAEDNALGETDRRRILAICRLLDGRDPHALLGVSAGADAKTLKRAYFKLSKDIHPDRYYGKPLGSFGTKMAQAFEAVSRAYARLTDTSAHGKKGPGGSSTHLETRDEPQTPQSYAAELFDRACQLEVQGDAMGAMKLFAAAVRVDAQLRYLRRAASCALAAGQPRSAVEYAKKAQLQAPNDPSSARLLAAAFRAAGKLTDAEEVLVMAMALKSENDTLTAELRHDLAEVRRLLTQ